MAPQTITLVQNPKWWGTPANARSIVIHIASSTAQLAQWMASGYVQVAQPTTVTQPFLTQMTGLPGAQSEVDTSATLLQLDMASSPESDLSPDLRVAIALTINRQDLVNQQVSWAVPGIAPGNSHLNVQGQPNYKPAPTGAPTTTIPAPTSSTSTTVVGAGGSVNFPVTPVPAQAAAFIAMSGLERTPGDPYYHSAFGAPFQLHMVYDSSDPWATAAAPTIRAELEAAGLDTTLLPVVGAAKTGQVLAAGFADLAVLPVTFTPYMSQTLSWYTTSLGPAGKNGSQDWTGFSSSQFDQLVDTASQQLNPNTAAGYYTQADTHAVGRDGLAASVRRAGRPGLEPHDRGRHGDAPQHEPPVVRAALGGPGTGVDQQHDAVAPGAIAECGLGLIRLPSGSVRARGPGRGPMATRYDLRTLRSNCTPVGVAE